MSAVDTTANTPIPLVAGPVDRHLGNLDDALSDIDASLEEIALAAKMGERHTKDPGMGVAVYRIREALTRATTARIDALATLEVMQDMGLDVMYAEAMAETETEIATEATEEDANDKPARVNAKILAGMVAEARAHLGHLSGSIRRALGADLSVDNCRVFDSIIALHGIIQDLGDEAGLDFEKLDWDRYCPDGPSAGTPATATEGGAS